MGDRMNNKAFTLIELLSVIVILAIIFTITTPEIINTLNLSKEKAYIRQLEIIQKAAERWSIDNIESNEKNYITIEELKNLGYIDQKEITNPKTKKELDGCIIIKKQGNQYKYEYSENC